MLPPETSVFHLFKSGRRNELKQRPFPPEWLALLAEDVPYHARLWAEDRGGRPAAWRSKATRRGSGNRGRAGKPKQLRHRHPALYEQLQLFYQQDPSTRFDARVGAATDRALTAT